MCILARRSRVVKLVYRYQRPSPGDTKGSFLSQQFYRIAVNQNAVRTESAHEEWISLERMLGSNLGELGEHPLVWFMKPVLQPLQEHEKLVRVSQRSER